MSVNVLMVGTGEYTTGYVHGEAAASDKSAGVVGLSLIDLKRRGFINQLLMAGTNGTKFPGIRQHLQKAIGDAYKGMDVSLETFPNDDVERETEAYKAAIQKLSPGDIVTVFTPDDTHFEIAMAAVDAKCHALIAKPIVKTVQEHESLQKAAEKNNVLVAMEVHKRWDPIYADAKDRIRSLGDFSLFQSYMSQPKSQLETFRAWAGRSSDISYYLNAHHVDFTTWALNGIAKPVSVSASAATGWAQEQGISTEDTITLTVDWQNLKSGNRATAVYTASWIAPKSDVHSQQRFFYMGHGGEITVDQAHRGYSIATNETGFASANPLFMKYTPDGDGYFAGQTGYGYRSFEAFVKAVATINSGESSVDSFHSKLATIQSTLQVTQILEAGRKSLDTGEKISI